MKQLYYIFGFIMVAGFLSCEEVVEVDLETATPRLVVEASINWTKGTDGRLQRITLTQTAPYFDASPTAASGAMVYIENSEGERFDFRENESSGVYINDDFSAELQMSYTLFIEYDDQMYQAQETLISVTDLVYITQNNGSVFSNEYVELKAYFEDPPEEENYYFYKFDSQRDHTINTIEDRLLNGNEMFALFVSEELLKGDKVEVSLYGVSEQYYHYIFTLISQSGESMGPFVTQPATVKGNIVNLTNADNYALGYFRLSQKDSYTYVVD